MIPAAAVEAAAEAIGEFNAKAIGGLPVPVKDLSGLDREHALGEARAALEAAAPHMLAAAWDEGHQAGWGDRDDDAQSGWVPSGYAVDTPNPYRSRA